MKIQAYTLLALLLVLQGCQQGSKKDPQSTAVYEMQLGDLEQTERKLSDHKILLNPTAASGKDIQVPDELMTNSKAIEEVQVLLSDYINKTHKLMSLADEKLVLFPQKAEIQSKENQAATMLGQILSTQKSDNIHELTQSSVADHTEFNIRFKRISFCLKDLNSVGLDFSNISNFSKAIESRNAKDLEAVQQGLEVCMYDTFRAKTLLQRNDGFKIDGAKVYEQNMFTFGTVFYSTNKSLSEELDKREKKKGS